MTEIPQYLQGTYTFGDTLLITSYSIGEDTLGKSVIVKKRGNFYYLNYIQNDSLYYLTVVKVIKYLSFEDFQIFHPKITDDNKNIFNVVDVKSQTYHEDYIVDDVSVVQLSKMLLKDEEVHNPQRIK